MKFSEEVNPNTLAIKAYRNGEIVINETTYAHPILIQGNTVSTWEINDFDSITADALEELASTKPEVILIGTGSQTRTPSRDMLNLMHTRGIGIEIMNTESACRTFNLLANDERRLVAALLV